MNQRRYSGFATGGGGFNPYSTGRKIYGAGRTAPTMGRVDPTGYRERDAEQKARRNAILARLRAGQTKNYASAAFNRSVR